MRKIKELFCKHLTIKDTEFLPSAFSINPIFIRNCIQCGKYLGNYTSYREINLSNQIEYMKSIEKWNKRA